MANSRSRSAETAARIARWCGLYDPPGNRLIPAGGKYGYNMGGFLPGRELRCSSRGGLGLYEGGHYQRWLLRPDGGYRDEAIARLYAQLAKRGIVGRLAYSIRSDGYVFMYMRIVAYTSNVTALAA